MVHLWVKQKDKDLDKGEQNEAINGGRGIHRDINRLLWCGAAAVTVMYPNVMSNRSKFLPPV